MIVPLLLTLAIVCGLLLLHGMLRRGAVYQYPFLAGATFTGFVLPQLIGLSHDPFLPPGALESTLVMAILSAVMCWLGAAMARPPRQAASWIYDDKRLLVASALLTLLGAYFYHAISGLPEEMTGNTQWTGLPVAYLFLSRMLTYGFAIALLLFARNGSRVALLIALFAMLFYFDRIVINGRRQDAIEFCTIIVLPLWFRRNRCVPRPVMLAGLIAGTLFISSAGDYRVASADKAGPKWSAISDIDFFGNLERLADQGGPELTNAVYIIGAVNRTMEFDLGALHWNSLVFSYVPAQLVGTDLKESLYYLPLTDPANEVFSHRPDTGSTLTGLSDAFMSFWYLGCLKFFLIAFIMQKLWWAARGGSMTAQLFYMLLPASAMEAITNSTHNFVHPWIHMTIFLLPALLLARRPHRAAAPAPRWQIDRAAPAQGYRP
jgi:hypothetical protein